MVIGDYGSAHDGIGAVGNRAGYGAALCQDEVLIFGGGAFGDSDGCGITMEIGIVVPLAGVAGGGGKDSVFSCRQAGGDVIAVAVGVADTLKASWR